ncbi:MAG: hypothetical protein WAW62_01005 [Candidatus Saccharimonas aalborgensis]
MAERVLRSYGEEDAGKRVAWVDVRPTSPQWVGIELASATVGPRGAELTQYSQGGTTYRPRGEGFKHAAAYSVVLPRTFDFANYYIQNHYVSSGAPAYYGPISDDEVFVRSVYETPDDLELIDGAMQAEVLRDKLLEQEAIEMFPYAYYGWNLRLAHPEGRPKGIDERSVGDILMADPAMSQTTEQQLGRAREIGREFLHRSTLLGAMDNMKEFGWVDARAYNELRKAAASEVEQHAFTAGKTMIAPHFFTHHNRNRAPHSAEIDEHIRVVTTGVHCLEQLLTHERARAGVGTDNTPAM